MLRFRAAVFVCCIGAALMNALALASGEECAVAPSCIHPVPQAAPPRLSVEENLQMIQCHLSCISEQHIPIQLLNQDTVWPSYSFSTLPCITWQKVEECTLGCTTRQKKPKLTVNRCRDRCVSECETNAVSESRCDSTCRRTFCRYGCSMQELHSSQNESSTNIPIPIAAPLITPHVNSSSTSKLFTVNITGATPSRQAAQGLEENLVPVQNVSYLYKVQQGSNISYIWQQDLSMPLDLSAFACGHIQVSFAVVSQQGHSQFSPAQSICVEGVGGWPSRVNESTISISYSEDTRDGYLGYAVANISWARPQDYQHLTSYTIRIFTKKERCGGLNTILSYNNIRKEATSAVIHAQALNGILMFGCSYSLSIVSMPEQPNQAVITTNIAPELIQPDPQIDLECRRVWDERGFMNISVNWSVSSTSPLPAIQRFSVIPLLTDSSQLGLRGRVYEYPRQWSYVQVDQTNYSVYLTNFSPQRPQHYIYQIEVRVERNNQYSWRRVPPKVTCTVSAESNPPTTMTAVTASNVEVQTEEVGEAEEQSLLRLQFDVLWSPPSISNGVLMEYELALGTERTATGTTPFLYHTTFPDEQLSATVNTTFSQNTSLHCLYAMVRSTNGYVWSEWSESKVIALDMNCSTTTPNTSLEDDSLSIFYQRAGAEAVRIAELSCDNTLEHVPDNISDRLYSLEQKLNGLPDLIRAQSSSDSLVEQLRRLEQKIDQVINAVTENNNEE